MHPLQLALETGEFATPLQLAMVATAALVYVGFIAWLLLVAKPRDVFMSSTDGSVHSVGGSGGRRGTDTVPGSGICASDTDPADSGVAPSESDLLLDKGVAGAT